MHFRLVVACPVRAILLTADEMGSREKEGPCGVLFSIIARKLLVSLENCRVGRRRHEKAVCVVNVSVENLPVIVVEFVDHICVIGLHWKCPLFCIEHARFIHVNPEVVDAAAPGKSVRSVHALPVRSCLTVEEVYPGRISWPTIAEVDLTAAVVHEEGFVCLRVDWVILAQLYLWVCDHDQCSIGLFNLLVHLNYSIHAERLRIVDEVLKVCCVRNVHPEDVHWKLARSKVLVPPCHRLRLHFIPLAEVETKTVDGR